MLIKLTPDWFTRNRNGVVKNATMGHLTILVSWPGIFLKFTRLWLSQNAIIVTDSFPEFRRCWRTTE